MPTEKLHRGRLIDHVQIVAADLPASRRFYEATLATLGLQPGGGGDEYFWFDELFVSSTRFEAGLTPTGPIHLAFQAPDRATVERFYRAGLAAGGRDDGAPGERARYHPGYYGAFLLDPDGNYIEAVFHGPAQRSATSVQIEFSRPV